MWPTEEGRRGTAEGAPEFGRGESAEAVFTAVVTGVRTNPTLKRGAICCRRIRGECHRAVVFAWLHVYHVASSELLVNNDCSFFGDTHYTEKVLEQMSRGPAPDDSQLLFVLALAPGDLDS